MATSPSQSDTMERSCTLPTGLLANTSPISTDWVGEAKAVGLEGSSESWWWEGEERALGSLGLDGLEVGFGLGVAERFVRLFLFPFVSIALRILSFFNSGFCVGVNVGSRVNKSCTMSVRQC